MNPNHHQSTPRPLHQIQSDLNQAKAQHDALHSSNLFNAEEVKTLAPLYLKTIERLQREMDTHTAWHIQINQHNTLKTISHESIQ